MIVVNVLSSIHLFCLAAFSTSLFMTHQRLKRRKNYERLVLSFHFVLFVLNVIVFLYNGLKQSHILQTMSNRLLQIYFFSWEPYLCLSKIQHHALYVERLGHEFPAMLVTLVCISEFCINLTRDLFLVSQGKKKAVQSLYVSSIIPSCLKLAKLHIGFSTNPCFQRVG